MFGCLTGKTEHSNDSLGILFDQLWYLNISFLLQLIFITSMVFFLVSLLLFYFFNFYFSWVPTIFLVVCFWHCSFTVTLFCLFWQKRQSQFNIFSQFSWFTPGIITVIVRLWHTLSIFLFLVYIYFIYFPLPIESVEHLKEK